MTAAKLVNDESCACRAKGEAHLTAVVAIGRQTKSRNAGCVQTCYWAVTERVLPSTRWLSPLSRNTMSSACSHVTLTR